MLSISCRPRRLHEQALRSYLRALEAEGAEAVASMATRRRSMPDLAGTRGAALLQRHGKGAPSTWEVCLRCLVLSHASVSVPARPLSDL